jgi:hopanoid biosynthesis associated protein HpnK
MTAVANASIRNLIVNADDLAWAEGVNRGIAEAHRNGIVTSASLLANGPAFASAVELVKATPSLGVGVHLNLSDGKPVSPPETVSSIVNNRGQFVGGPEALLLRVARRNLRLKEVEIEWESQIQKVVKAGIHPTHLDGHKHVHMLPGMFEIVLRVAKRNGIAAVRISHEGSSLRAALSSGENQNIPLVMKQGVQARVLKLLARDARALAEAAGIATTDYFCGIAQTGELTVEGMKCLLQNLPEGTTEVMCHPGFMDRELEESATRLQDSRELEVEILTNPEIRNLVASQGIRLIDYAFVAGKA